jgi:hypothetical protein
VLMNTIADDPEQQSGVAVFLQAAPVLPGAGLFSVGSQGRSTPTAAAKRQ